MATLEFFYDVGSPYSYLAATQVEAIVADAGGKLVWRPFLLGGVFKEAQNTAPALNMAKAKYMAEDLKRWAKWYGVPFEVRFPPMNTLLAMRALTALPQDRLAEASIGLFQAYWVHGNDLADPAVVAASTGDEAVARAQDPEVKERLKETSAEAVRRGAFGAPTMFLGEEMFFGNDRLPMVANRLRELR